VTTHSELSMSFVKRYYTFLLVNIYFVTLVSTTISDAISRILSSPPHTIELIATAIPGVAVDMIQFMALQGLTVGAEKILRINGILRTIFFSGIASTDYERARAMCPTKFEYGYNLAFACLIWTLICCYMTMTPLILPFGVLYFTVDYIIQKYNLLYVHGQIGICVLIGLKMGYWQQALLVPLPLLTWIYKTGLEDSYDQVMDDTGVSLLNAATIDMSRDEDKVKKLLQRIIAEKIWKHPHLRLDLDDPLRQPEKLQKFSDLADDDSEHDVEVPRNGGRDEKHGGANDVVVDAHQALLDGKKVR